MLILYISSLSIYFFSFLSFYIKICEQLISFGFGVIIGLSLFHLLADAISNINNIHILGVFYIGSILHKIIDYNQSSNQYINSIDSSEYLPLSDENISFLSKREFLIRSSFIFHTVIIGLDTINFLYDFNKLLIYLICLGIHQILETISLRQIVRKNIYLDLFFISILPITIIVSEYIEIDTNKYKNILSYINAFISGIMFNIVEHEINIYFLSGLILMYILGIYS